MRILAFLLYLVVAEASGERDDKQFSVFNIIRFPNDVCTSKSNVNGTCYTASECTSLGGTSSGSCASSFGVCCVFNLACGGTTSANNSYAAIASFSTTTDTDPCTYTYCKNTDDVCKLRIDYDTMVLADPVEPSSSTAPAYTEGLQVGDCLTDTLQIGVPGFASPPTICGYNSGQHMWVPICPACVTITINIDTGNTATTRNWNIRVSQYECGTNNLNIPEENCLQYHTAQTGTIASFNWDTTSKTALTITTALDNAHLSDQNYDICIRRARGYCSICFSPEVHTTAAGSAQSFGLSAANPSDVDASKSAVGSLCLGVTAIHATVDDAGNSGLGDYLEIPNMQTAPGTAGTLGVNKICGGMWNSIVNTATAATICSFTTPFRVGVRFDNDETVGANAGDVFDHIENENPAAGGGIGYTGFWLSYWMNTC